MSDMSATVSVTPQGFAVAGYEKLNYDFKFIDNVFDTAKTDLADCYTKWGRVLAVMDENMKSIYGSAVQAYFDHYQLPLTIHAMPVGEKAKTIASLLGIVDAMNSFGIIRKEPVLVIGGGLVTDTAGFATACYRRNTNFIRVPTTVIGLIDASVSIKVAVNYGNYKNRLGAYHAPIHTFLDFNFLKTLPVGQVRNGFAEIIKISSCADIETFNLLDAHCEELIETHFGRTDGSSKEIKEIADKICWNAIKVMLELESPNLHEIGLDRVIAYGHTWSPLHELVPETPLRHGHAISIDMAYTATIGKELGLMSEQDHTRILKLFSRAGLSIDHALFTDEVLEKATAAILRTRDGLLRLATPGPLGKCTFVNDYTLDNLKQILATHKKFAHSYPRQGDGLEAYVDATDTGEGNKEEILKEIKDQAKTSLKEANGYPTKQVDEAMSNGHASNGTNGVNGHANGANGHTNGHTNGLTNGHAKSITVHGS